MGDVVKSPKSVQFLSVLHSPNSHSPNQPFIVLVISIASGKSKVLIYYQSSIRFAVLFH